jgi:hypothetical protein
LRATYYISFDNWATETQIYPSNSPGVKLSQEPGEIFFRWKVDAFRLTKLKNSVVYNTIHSYFFDPTYFQTDIYFRIKERGVVTYSFKGVVLDGDINTEYSVYECTPEPDDAYNDILRVYQTKYTSSIAFSMWGLAPDVSLYCPTLETNLFANALVSGFTVLSDVAKSVSWQNNAGGTQYARLQLTEKGAEDVLITVFVNVFSGDSFKLQLVDESFVSISNQVTVSGTGKVELTQSGSSITTYLELSVTAGTPQTGAFEYVAYYANDYTNAHSLQGFINSFTSDSNLMNLSIGTVVSTYLWNDSLDTDAPDAIKTYITANPNNDYVIEGAANWNDLVLTKTQIWSTSKTEKEDLSFKDLMDILKLKLRAYWFIDSDGSLRIEHEKYFRSYTSQTDITSATYSSYKPEIDNKIYKYDRSEIYQQINYKENNESTEDWVSKPINYLPVLTSKEVKEVNVPLSSDIGGLIANASSASAGGLALMRTVANGSVRTVVFDESTAAPGTYYLNANLGWYYLSENYFDYFAEAESGTVNGSAHTFAHVKEFLKQENVRFVPVSAIEWKRPFTLAGGTGWLTGATYDPETGFCSINVGFNPYS